MIFHCPDCGDVLDVPESKLPYSGNCPYCAAPVQLREEKAIEKESEPPPAVERPRPRPSVRPPRRPAQTAPTGGKVVGTIGSLVAVGVILFASRLCTRTTREVKQPSVPKIDYPKYQYPRGEKEARCVLCSNKGVYECRTCKSTCPRCGVRKALQNPDCPQCAKPCLRCKGTGKVVCVLCKYRRKKDSP